MSEIFSSLRHFISVSLNVFLPIASNMGFIIIIILPSPDRVYILLLLLLPPRHSTDDGGRTRAR